MESEYKNYEENETWREYFVKLDSLSVRSSWDVAKNEENAILNRYINVAPYDQSRIKLQRTNHDYINASLIEVPQANRLYILTQGPLPNTISHFWLMIWEQDSRAIVMLNKLIENTTTKCEFYWPDSAKATLELKDVHLTVKFVNHTFRKNFTIREFLLVDHVTKQSKTINQFHYTEWPDFGQPNSPVSFLKLLAAVRNSGALDNHGPTVVHCSAGIGRSGTFCLIDSALLMIETKRSTEGITLSEILLEMRKHRAGLVQTPEQLRFSYKAIIYGTKLLNLTSDKVNTSRQDKTTSEHDANHGSSATTKSTKRSIASIDGPQSLINALENVDSDDDGMTLLDDLAQIEPPQVKIAKQSTQHVLGSLPSLSGSQTKVKQTSLSHIEKNVTSSSKESGGPSNKTSKQDKNPQQKKSLTKDTRPSNLTLDSDTIGDMKPLPSPGNVMNQPLLGQKSYSEASRNSSSGTNILQRRRERELFNLRLAEKTKNMKENMKIHQRRVEARAKRLKLLKQAGAACVIAVVFGSAFYLCYKNYFSN